jgi:hypothetical protein
MIAARTGVPTKPISRRRRRVCLAAWGQKIGGAVGGGVITYRAGQSQRVAVATGLTEILWPTEITTAKVSILGVD